MDALTHADERASIMMEHPTLWDFMRQQKMLPEHMMLLHFRNMGRMLSSIFLMMLLQLLPVQMLQILLVAIIIVRMVLVLVLPLILRSTNIDCVAQGTCRP